MDYISCFNKGLQGWVDTIYFLLCLYISDVNIPVSDSCWHCNGKAYDWSCSGRTQSLIFSLCKMQRNLINFLFFLYVLQDGAARPMTAVRAAGYSSSIARGAFTHEILLHVCCPGTLFNCLIRILNEYILTSELEENMIGSFILIVWIFRLGVWSTGTSKRTSPSIRETERRHVCIHLFS